jgi:hypothetical protein
MKDLELLNYGYGGMLSDSDTTILGELYDYILDNPLKSIELLACTSKNPMSDCVVKLGKDLCKETGNTELCDMVQKAEIVNEASKVLIKKEEEPTAQIDISTHLNNLVQEFGGIDCKNLTQSQKSELVKRLNSLEEMFISQNRKSEFNSMLNKLQCDVVEEFRCDDKDKSITKFEVAPNCKPKFLAVWGKPVAIGGATGVGVGFAWHKVFKGSTTSAVLLGLCSGGAMAYYMKKKNEKVLTV